MEIEFFEQSAFSYVGLTVSNALIHVFKKKNEEFEHRQASLHVQSNREFQLRKLVQFAHICSLTGQDTGLLFELLLELWTLALFEGTLPQKSIGFRDFNVLFDKE